MSLNQHAFSRTLIGTDLHRSAPINIDGQPCTGFTWHQHIKLHEFMERLYVARVPLHIHTFNGGELELFIVDIDRLEQQVMDARLPYSEDGCFFEAWIDQDQMAQDMRAQDLAFCAWAREQLQAGNRVFYSCCW